MWTFLANILTKLATLFLVRQSGKDAERADANEKGLDNVEKANRAASDPDILERVRDKYQRR